MEEFDLYGDLELLHAQEKQIATEDLKWKDKYEVALNTIQKLQAEKKELNKKVKQLEINFASLFDTARAEIKRKDTQIFELRAQRDNICFRRSKPLPTARPLNKNDVHKAVSSENIHVNPFSGQPRKAHPPKTELSQQLLDDKLPSKEQFENGKRKFDTANNREQVPRSISRDRHREQDAANNREQVPRSISREKGQSRDRHRERDTANNREQVPRSISREKDQSRDRHRDRSKNRNRSRDRADERRRNRLDDRDKEKHRDASEDLRDDNRSKERSKRRDERKKEKKRRRHDRDTSQTKSSDSSCDKADKIHCNSKQMNYTNEKQLKFPSDKKEEIKIEDTSRDTCNSSSYDTKNQINDSKTELNQLQNVPNLLNEKRANEKIEILEIEILKDVKELKKNKLKAEKLPKPEPIDPAKIATEKSNQFLEALFEDSILNKSKESSRDLNDDLYVCTPQSNTISDDSKKEEIIEKDENCNLNFQTPQKQSITKAFDDLFGPSPAGSLCLVEVNQNSIKSAGESTSDSDFVPIIKPIRSKKDKTPMEPLVEQVVIDENVKTIYEECFEMKPPKNPVTVNLVDKNETGNLEGDFILALKQTDLNSDFKKFAKVDENCNVKHQTPQKQPAAKLLEDLFGPSPGGCLSGQKNSVTSMDESSSDLYFEPVIKPQTIRNDKETQAETQSKVHFVIDDNFTDNVLRNNEICHELKEVKQPVKPSSAAEKIKNEKFAKNFKFIELDSSFYSSEEDEINYDCKYKLNTFRVEIESPPFENVTPSKHNQEIETEKTGKNVLEEKSKILNKSDEKLFGVNCVRSTNEENRVEKCRDTSKIKTRTDDLEKTYKSSFPESTKQSRTSNNFSEMHNERAVHDDKKDDSKKRCHSSKHNTTSYNSNSRSASRENEHRSRSKKEKHHHHHHHHHHKHRSKESIHTKGDSSSHRISRKHCKSKNYEHISRRDRVEKKPRYFKDKPDSLSKQYDSLEARSSPMLVYYDDDAVKDHTQKVPKNTDPDQVFFLHCDDISDDDEIFGDSFSDENKKESIDNSGQNNEKNKLKETMKEQNSNKNVIEIESTEFVSIEKNKNEVRHESDESKIIKEMESRDSLEFNANPMNSHENTVEIETEKESIDKDLKLSHSANLAKETPSSSINENSSNAVYSISIDIDKTDSSLCHSEDVCHLNDTNGISDQQFPEDHQLQNFQNNCEKVDDLTDNSTKMHSTEKVQTEAENSDEFKEQESSKEVCKSDTEQEKSEEVANSKSNIVDQIVSLNEIDEKIDLNESSEEIQNLEVVFKGQQNHKKDDKSGLPYLMHSFQPSSHHVELNQNTNIQSKELSVIEENDLLNGDKTEKVLSSNVSDEISLDKLERTDNFQQMLNNEKNNISSENVTDCQLIIREPFKHSYYEFPVQESTSPKGDNYKTNNCHEIICQDSNKPSKSSPIEKVESSETNGKEEISSQITDNISMYPINELTDQSVSQASTLLSLLVSPQKSLNSADDLESSNSNSDLMSSGRRRKTKTPRKHTDVCKNTSMTMVSDRYKKSDEVQSSITLQCDSKLISSEISPYCTELEIIPGSEVSNQNKTLWLETNAHKENSEHKQEPTDNDIQITTEEQNCSLENENEITREKCPKEEQNPLDEKRPESASKKIIHDSNEKKRESNTFSSSTSGEFSEQLEKQIQNIEEPAQDLSKTKEISLYPTNTDFNKDQQNTNSQMSFPTSTTSEEQIADAVENTKNVFSIESVRTEKLHEKIAMLNEVQKEPGSSEVLSETINSLLRSDLNEINDKIDETIVESFSITIKRNRNKKKNIKHSTKVVDTISNEEVNDTNKTPFPCESLVDQSHSLKDEVKYTTAVDNNENNHENAEEKTINESNDTTCHSSFGNKKALNESTSKNTKQNDQQHQMIKHFMDSEDTLVGTCNFPSAISPNDVVDTKSKETDAKKRKRKSDTSLDNEDCKIKNKTTETSPTCEATKVNVKRKYKKRTTHILESSISIVDIDLALREESKIVSKDDSNNKETSEPMEHFKSPDLKEPTKKRKYTNKNLNNSSNKSNEFSESLHGPENSSSLSQLESACTSEELFDKLHPPTQTGESLGEILHSSNETTDLSLKTPLNGFPEKTLEGLCDNTKPNNPMDNCLNNSLSSEGNNKKHKKTKKQKKRKRSRSSDVSLEDAFVQQKRSRNTVEDTSQPSIKSCDKTSYLASGKNLPESIKQLQQSPPHEKSVSIALTPTHHKIFLNDVFSNDPPPVYNANDDDLQYHEIDDRMRSIFQSPSYIQPSSSSNGECSFDNKNEDFEPISNANLEVDESTLNESERTQCDTSMSSRTVSVGSNEYVIESVGSHTANVFITRKKCKKRTKIVATAV